MLAVIAGSLVGLFVLYATGSQFWAIAVGLLVFFWSKTK
jgi:hypothetical protein